MEGVKNPSSFCLGHVFWISATSPGEARRVPAPASRICLQPGSSYMRPCWNCVTWTLNYRCLRLKCGAHPSGRCCESLFTNCWVRFGVQQPFCLNTLYSPFKRAPFPFLSPIRSPPTPSRHLLRTAVLCSCSPSGLAKWARPLRHH